MSDAEDDVMDEEYDPVTSMSVPLMRQVLAEIARARAEDDGREGYFRDFADGCANSQLDEQSKELALQRLRKAGPRMTWRLMLDTACAEVAAEKEPVKLRRRLIAVAALSVAWTEALDRRKDERRIELKMRPTATMRIAKWWNSVCRRWFGAPR